MKAPQTPKRSKTRWILLEGEKIYHVPGQRDYSKTEISPEKGERWFCTEDEARAAGWRRAQR